MNPLTVPTGLSAANQQSLVSAYQAGGGSSGNVKYASAYTPPPNPASTPVLDIKGNQQAVYNSNLGQYRDVNSGQRYDVPTAPTSPSDQTTYSTPEQQNTINSAKSNLTQAQTDYQDAANQVHNTINSITYGSIPLNAGEQAQVDELKQHFQTLIDQQKLQNTSASGLANVRGYQTGAAEYDPTFQAKTIGSIVTAGLNKLADWNIKMAGAVSSLTQSLKDNDIKNVKDAWTVYQDAADRRQKELQKTIDDTQSAIKYANDLVEQKKKDDLDALIHSDTVSYQEKQQAITMSQLSETERHNKKEELIAQENANKGAYEVTSDGRIFNKNTGKFTDDFSTGAIPNGELTPGKTGNPLLDNNTKISISGIPYVDGTNLKGKNADTAQLQAAKLGIPYLGTNGADAMANIDTARTNMDEIKTSLDGILPSNWATRGVVAPLNQMQSFFQTNDQIASFNAYRSAAIQALRAMAGSKGLRINQAEILQSVNQDIPKITDTVGAAAGKIAKVNAMLDAQEKGLIGQMAYNKFVQPPEISGTAPKVKQALDAGYTPDQIVGQLKNDPTVGDKVNQALQAGYSAQDIIDFFK